MMRRSVVKKGQDICLFCALRGRVEPGFQSPRVIHHVRSYKSSASSWRPAGAAAARKEEEEYENDYDVLSPNVLTYRSSNSQQLRAPTQPFQPHTQSSNPGWTCQCGHVNSPNRNDCTLCTAPKFPNAQFVSRRAPQSTPRADSATQQQNSQSSKSEHALPRAARIFARNQAVDLSRQSTWSIHRDRPGRPQHNRAVLGDVDGGRSLGTDAQRTWPRRDQVNTQSRLDQRQDTTRNKFGGVMDSVRWRPPSSAESASQTDKPNGRSVHGMQELEALANSTRARSPPSRRRPPRNDDYAEMSRRTSGPPSTTPLVPNVDVFESRSVAETEDFDSAGRKRSAKKPTAAEDRRSRLFESDFDDVVTNTAQAAVSHQVPASSRRKGRRQDTGFDFDAAEAELYGEEGGWKKRRKPKRVEHRSSIEKPRLQIPEFISVENLAQALKVKPDAFLVKLEEEGFEGARYDHILDASTSAMLADLYGFEPIVSDAGMEDDLFPRPAAEDPSILPPRPPIVTIMGHVDHGKTTILDWLRKSSVVESEHGGITQHIGAFSVTMPGSERQITFLDTPGHAAFLDMRRRGANVTDIVVLVVAADDSVKPQTIEAIKHALEAKVQIIVAINKIDKEDSNVDRVKQDLSRHDITVEDFGGDYQAIPVSGKTGQGMADLEEAIITLADVSDFRAETDGPAEGWVIESKVTAAGRVATVLVRRGTLKQGDFIVAGTTWGRVRTLRNDAGLLVSEAPPGTPVQVDGWRGIDPTAGLEVLQAETEEQAKRVVQNRLEKTEIAKSTNDMSAINAARTEEAEARAKVLAWRSEQEWSKKRPGRRPKENEGWVESVDSSGQKKVHFVIKADVAGSAEALKAAVSAIGNNEAVANVIHTGVGHLSESDIQLLASTGEIGYAISFNQPVEGSIRRLAEAAELQILDHNIIYKVTDDVKERVSDELSPLVTQKVLGEAEVGQIFEISVKREKVKIAGCKVTNGTISRSNQVRVLRRNEVIYTGTLGSLKNVKKDVTEMRKGTECGMAFDNWTDFQPGDQVQSFEEIKEKRKVY